VVTWLLGCLGLGCLVAWDLVAWDLVAWDVGLGKWEVVPIAIGSGKWESVVVNFRKNSWRLLIGPKKRFSAKMKFPKLVGSISKQPRPTSQATKQPSNQSVSRLLLVLMLLPLLWLNTGSTHDWGDDFAQYLIQAKNINEGRTQTDNGLVFPQGELPFAIKAYPIGFPLIIAPVYHFFGLQIKPYLVLNSFLLIFMALLSFEYFKKFNDDKKALLIALLIGYNLFSLLLKKEIVSEFAFTALLMAILFSLKKSDRDASLRDYLLAGILTGLLITIRIAGIVMIPAVIGCMLMWKWLPAKNRLQNGLVFFSAALAIFVLLNMLVFDVNTGDFLRFYSKQFSAQHLKADENISAIFAQLPALFLPVTQSPVVAFLLLAVVLIGLLARLDKSDVAEGFFLLYLLLIVTYPYTSGTFRFIYPITPFIIFYFINGCEKILSFFLSNQRSFPVLIIIVALSIFTSFIYNSGQEIADGPAAKDAKASFSFIQTNTPAEAIVLFPRARAMVLYGKRKSTFLTQLRSADENLKLLRTIKCDYVLYPDERSGAYNESLAQFLMAQKENYDTLFKDDRYLLLKLKPVSIP
jgi:hypothetical protein